MSETEADQLIRNLHTMRESGAILEKIGHITAELSCKRVTLEEKMIRRHFHELAIVTSKILQKLHERARDSQLESKQDVLDELDSINKEIEAQLAELLKIINYDLNFLEQYFEHGFLGKLINECRFIERMQATLDKL